jgi:hypothetical protein
MQGSGSGVLRVNLQSGEIGRATGAPPLEIYSEWSLIRMDGTHAQPIYEHKRRTGPASHFSTLTLKRDHVKDLLGKALALGENLLRSQKDKNDEQAEKDAEKWGQQTHDLIAAAYGEGEAALFLDSSGYVFYGNNSAKSKIRNWIDGRMRRISELIKRTDSLTPRADFDPAKFE